MNVCTLFPASRIDYSHSVNIHPVFVNVIPIFSKFQTDLKTTNIEEMKIAMETYYEEVSALYVCGSLFSIHWL